MVEAVARVRLLDLFRDNPKLQGQVRLDALLERGDIFLPYLKDQGFAERDVAYTAHLGLDRWDPDEHAQYIEPALAKHRSFGVTYTADPHRIQVARTGHGFPLLLIGDLDTYERSYKELQDSGASPLHIDVRWPPRRDNGRYPWAAERKAAETEAHT
jgi:hypothetical protein